MYEAAVIGVSAGGMHALKAIIPALPAEIALTIAVVQHLDARSDAFLPDYLNQLSAVRVKEAEDKEPLLPGTVYIAPPAYHLLIEPDKSFSLSVDEKVNFSRPSIDLLFESAAEAYRNALIGIILTGANSDGAKGLKAVKDNGGLAIVQDPLSAQAPFMPQAALKATAIDHLLPLERIAPTLDHLCKGYAYGTAPDI